MGMAQAIETATHLDQKVAGVIFRSAGTAVALVEATTDLALASAPGPLGHLAPDYAQDNVVLKRQRTQQWKDDADSYGAIGGLDAISEHARRG